MPAPETCDEGFDFNDLSQHAPTEQAGRSDSNGPDAHTAPPPKAKRIACILCRKRKLKCDGQRPSCGTCKRLAHDCAYDEVRKKSGPKRGYVKALEARLQQVETLLKSQEATEATQQQNSNSNAFQTDSSAPPVRPSDFQGQNIVMDNVAQVMDTVFQPGNGVSPGEMPSNMQAGSADNSSGSDPFSWEMIGLGLDEPLPDQDIINELTQLYFDKFNIVVPMIHRPRFLAAMNLAPHMRPPICLRYIMWTLAASTSEKYSSLQEHFYYRARKYIQMDEMKGHGESMLTLAHCQAWALICSYEFKSMYFPRAWISAGRAVRMAQMMNLHKLDGSGLDVKQCLAPPRDWVEREERRRTFWMCFNVDRYASIGTGWPMTIDEQDIATNLPATDEAFERSKPEKGISMEQALAVGGSSRLTPFAGVCVLACMFGRNLLHLHRPTNNEREDDINGEFWERHRRLDNMLLNLALALPEEMRLPAGINNPNVVFMTMKIHTSVICLHQAAIFKADKNRMPAHIAQESKIRCVTAASEIAGIMRLIAHMDTSLMNPFISFCVYVAARVFVQYLKNRPGDGQMNNHLQFLLQAMQALKKRNPLTESFLVQLDLDLVGTGIMSPFGSSTDPRPPATVPVNTDGVGCCPVFELRESQSDAAPINTFHRGSDATGTKSHLSNSTGTEPTPGPPFHLAQQVNMDTEAMPFTYSPKDQHVFDLPSRQRTPSAVTPREMQTGQTQFSRSFGRAERATSDMDLSPDGSGENPSPSNSGNSQNVASSRSSYSTPSDRQSKPQRQSYGGNVAGLSVMADNGSNAPNNNFTFTTTSDDFEQLFYTSTSGVGEWDMSGGAGMTGLTPMSESAWTQMLDGGGWEGFGPGHGTDAFEPPVSRSRLVIHRLFSQPP
ncbi:Tropolone cluster transcription factor tropK [Lasiodiplodia hormozganensis]|uniref:Tropolone cluster transcription factor tropK n=1 Tax=Lasiodiplodia hormozganensis TaxID=869390 RepID=A0AA39Y5M7_9PEZI|nr:Tropolone cluster transcription factor tropK [Lasiodiplodia hormozganensis]